MSSDLLRIEYRLERMPWQDPDQDQLDVWWATLQLGRLSDDDMDIAWEGVARATMYGLDIDRSIALGQAPFDVADAHSADAAYYYEHVYDVDGNMLPDVEEQFQFPPGRVLFLHDVRVPQDLRHRGYGSLLVSDAILTLAPHGTGVFAHPGPTDLDPDTEDGVARLRSETENTRFLGALGFVPFRDRLWVLDLSTQSGIDGLTTIRRAQRPG